MSEIVYPDLHKRANSLADSVFYSGEINGVVDSLVINALRTSRDGILISNFYLDPEKPGFFRSDMSRAEVESLVDSSERFLKEPQNFRTFAEALTNELESLVCGNKLDRYQPLVLPRYKRAYLRLENDHPRLAMIIGAPWRIK